MEDPYYKRFEAMRKLNNAVIALSSILVALTIAIFIYIKCCAHKIIEQHVYAEMAKYGLHQPMLPKWIVAQANTDRGDKEARWGCDSKYPHQRIRK